MAFYSYNPAFRLYRTAMNQVLHYRIVVYGWAGDPQAWRLSTCDSHYLTAISLFRQEKMKRYHTQPEVNRKPYRSPPHRPPVDVIRCRTTGYVSRRVTWLHTTALTIPHETGKWTEVHRQLGTDTSDRFFSQSEDWTSFTRTVRLDIPVIRCIH